MENPEVYFAAIGEEIEADAIDMWALYQPPNIDAQLRQEFPGYVEFYGTHGPADIAQRIRERYTTATGNMQPTIGYLAFIAGAPVGMATAALNRMKGSDIGQYGLETVLNLNWLVVQRARGQGVGQCLARTVLAATRTAATTEGDPYFGSQILTMIHDDNVPSKAVARAVDLAPIGPVYMNTETSKPAQLWLPAGMILATSKL